ncbi:MAG: TonB-dependent receptor [Bacteroidetes bacterium GWA2_31_9b]|nr:MAG: TonB-dependent receptor [Bacteroidetes bacterium GWA2_31_9b]
MKGFKRILKTSLLVFFFIMNIAAYSSNVQTQTIRGQIVDQDSKTPLIGANVIILNTDPIIGSSTDANGYFRLEQVHVGRINLKVTCMGYEDKTVPNILVGSGKEIVLEIELSESLIQLEDVVVTANGHKAEALNEMAVVSAKAFTVEETQRYAGSLSDPARMVSGYAGVTGDAQGNNDIVVRGNSSKGILWKLDGMDIPNPNHFSDEGATGGPINALNSAMLNNSDFFSGAFAPEYGNAYSGVFDMKLRNGNNEKREYSASIGILGTDVTLEGPFSKNYLGSYLINYRYSSLDILDKLNLVHYYGVPKYQDASFKFNLPTKKLGTFQLIGFGGLSNIYQEDFAEENEDSLTRTADFGAHVAFAAIKHIYPINDRTFITSYVSTSSTENSTDYKKYDDIGSWYTAYYDLFKNTSIRISTSMNTKINAKHRLKMGITYSDLGYNMFAKQDVLNTGSYTTEVDTDGRAGLVQGYLNWKYRIADELTLVSGLHYIQFLLNNSNSIEPRFGVDWNFAPKQSLCLGFGIHSKVESIATYFATVDNGDGTYTTPNKDLELSKSAHYVLGYSNQISKNVNLKVEAYYQQLFNLAVENDINSTFVLNNIRSGYTNKELINKGKGYNYGVELTLERFYSNNYYFLITSSLYESKLTALDGISRNSRFNGNYAGNILIGKEFRIGNPSKNRTIGLNTKFTLIGGQRYTPIDLAASIIEGSGVESENQYYAKKADDVFSMNMGITYRRNRKKTTHEFKIDIQNVTNNKAMVYEYYDDMSKNIEKAYQLALLPNISYTIQF